PPRAPPHRPRSRRKTSARVGPEHREPAVAVAPVARRREAGVEQQRAKAVDRVLARVLGVDPFARGEAAAAAGPGDGDLLAGLEVHLDARPGDVVARDVAPLPRRE